MSRLVAGIAAVACRLARPQRKPLKKCSCGTFNEPERTSCIGCGKRF